MEIPRWHMDPLTPKRSRSDLLFPPCVEAALQVESRQVLPQRLVEHGEGVVGVNLVAHRRHVGTQDLRPIGLQGVGGRGRPLSAVPQRPQQLLVHRSPGLLLPDLCQLDARSLGSRRTG